MARACADAYVRLVRYYQTERGLPAAEADALARQPHEAAAPSHELSWLSLNGLLEHDPQGAEAVWGRVKRDAAQYVEGGLHVADALGFTSPWQRAQLVTLRAALYDDWQPSGAVERALLDT